MKLSDYIKAARSNDLQFTKTLNIAILRSYSCEMMESILIAKLNQVNFGCKILFGAFNNFIDESINENSKLYEFNADFILFNFRYEDFSFNLNVLESCILAIRNKTNAIIIINNFTKPYYSPINTYEAQGINNINNKIRECNLKIAELCESFMGLYVIDIEELIRKLGFKQAYDLRMWEIAKNPYSLVFYEEYSEEVLKIICAYYGMRKKCIVLDLDNTLWHGIIGEDGFDGIRINVEFQRQLLYLKNTGILLAICSKNNWDDAITVIEKHNDMILRKEDFVLSYINWDNKYENILKIADKLNIGLDSILFIDDSEAECEFIRIKLPEVDVLCLPKNQIEYVDALRSARFLDYLQITSEDGNKTEMLRTELKREELKEKISYDDYLKCLEMVITIKNADDFTIARIAQLTQKTNQFNFTGKRYTKVELQELLLKGYKIYYLNYCDKFGDSGITGAAIINTGLPNEWEIDSFLLSCRILNRGIEYAFMEFIVKEADKYSISKIWGKFIETKKNKPAMDAYKNFNFCLYHNIWMLSVSNNYRLQHFVKVNDTI